MELTKTVWVSLTVNLTLIGCIGMSPGDGIRLTHHCHHLFHISYYPNQLEDTNDYIKYLLQPHHIGECNEFIIGVK